MSISKKEIRVAKRNTCKDFSRQTVNICKKSESIIIWQIQSEFSN